MAQNIDLFFALLIGLIVGYQLAKWVYYGELDILFWTIKKKKGEER